MEAAVQSRPEASAGTLSNRPSRAEWLSLWCLLGGLVIFDLATYSYYASVWCDDVIWSEPAINLVKTGQFTTSVWQFQPAGTFWAVNPPLYPLALSGWLRIFGTSLLAVRSFNFVLLKLGILLVWLISWKGDFARTFRQRMTIIGLLEFGYGISFSYRCSRPDILGMVALLLLWLALLGDATRYKKTMLFLIAGLLPWIGIQVALFGGLVCTGAAILFRRISFRELLAIFLGIGAGGVLLLLVYAQTGMLHYLLSSIFHVAGEHTRLSGSAGFWGSLPRRLASTASNYVADFSLIPLVLALMYFSFRGNKSADSPTREAIMGAAMIFFGIPLIFNLTGHFAFYYSYLLFVPVLLVLCRVYSRSPGIGSTFSRRMVLGLSVAMAILIGLPLRLLLTASFCHLLPRRDVTQAIHSTIHPDDVVFCQYACFFEARQVASRVYVPIYSKALVNLSDQAHDFSPAEKKSITLMIVQPAEKEILGRYFGGEWSPIGEPFGDQLSLDGLRNFPALRQRLAHHFATPQMLRLQLQAFRRTRD